MLKVIKEVQLLLSIDRSFHQKGSLIIGTSKRVDSQIIIYIL